MLGPALWLSLLLSPPAIAAAPDEPTSTPAAPKFATLLERRPLGPEPIEARLSAPRLILFWGYPSEVHRVQTEDGYILTMNRIPWGSNGPPLAGDPPRPVVFMQHGLLQTADQWLLRGPERDLAFMLADLGYDVWMGNFRGCTYSKKHILLSNKDKRFWDFGWHENGYYDLPAMIDYALGVTSQPSLFYIGHSMGTTTLMVLLSTRPEYNAKVRVGILMAPVVFFRHAEKGGLGSFRRSSLGRSLTSSRLIGEAFPRGTSEFCKASRAIPLCLTIYNNLGAYSKEESNATLFRILIRHYPSGASLTQFLHYLQVMVSGEFKQYDYGENENRIRYGQRTPPKYNLKNVIAPMHYHYAEADEFAVAEDVEELPNKIPGSAGLHKVPIKDFGHGDHLYAVHTYELEYKEILDIMSHS